MITLLIYILIHIFFLHQWTSLWTVILLIRLLLCAWSSWMPFSFYASCLLTCLSFKQIITESPRRWVHFRSPVSTKYGWYCVMCVNRNMRCQQLFCDYPLSNLLVSSFQVFHYLSLALLTFFMVELCGKIFAYRLEFLHHKFEVFDGIVVVVSFILDIVYITKEDAFDAMGLLILLRLWRVARIINGTGMIFTPQ